MWIPQHNISSLSSIQFNTIGSYSHVRSYYEEDNHHVQGLTLMELPLRGGTQVSCHYRH